MRLAISNDIIVEPVGLSIGIGGDTNPSYTGDNLLSYTFDKKYISGGADVLFSMLFSVPVGDAKYISLFGHNLGDFQNITIDIEEFGGATILSGYVPTSNRPITFFLSTEFTTSSVLIKINKDAGDVVIMSHIAAGRWTDFSAVDTDTGQDINTANFKSGYPRIPMSLGRKLKSTQNDQAAPMATIMQTIGQKVSLSLDNVLVDYAKTNIVDYQKYWTTNGFMVCDEPDETVIGIDTASEQSYMAFNFTPRPPKTHSGTRRLVNLSYTFTTYNGL